MFVTTISACTGVIPSIKAGNIAITVFIFVISSLDILFVIVNAKNWIV
jgi:hypothetical protein